MRLTDNTMKKSYITPSMIVVSLELHCDLLQTSGDPELLNLDDIVDTETPADVNGEVL